MDFVKLNLKGQVLVIVALLMLGLVALAALALDLGMAYGVKAKLNAAVDTASYEAAKALGQGGEESSMKTKAIEIATAYFNANYPSGYLGARPNSLTITPVRDTNTGLWNVTVSAKAQMSTLFAGVFGTQYLNIGATSESVRKTLDMVLVLDTSSSLIPVFDDPTQSTDVKRSANAYVDLFNSLDDRVGLVAFSTGAYPMVSICGEWPNSTQNPPSGTLNCSRGFDKRTVKQAINALSANGNTASGEGMKKALGQLNALPPGMRSKNRVIVFFSDGQPNTINGRFPLGTGGTFDGNLFSETWNYLRPHTVFDQFKYYDVTGGRNKQITSLPISGTDIDGTVPFASYNNRRMLSGDNSDVGLKCDANKAARNMVENVANMARSQGITVYSLGYGNLLNQTDITSDCTTSNEIGATILNRIANTKESDSYDASQPSGLYCYADNISHLKPCFDKIASAILRISK